MRTHVLLLAAVLAASGASRGSGEEIVDPKEPRTGVIRLAPGRPPAPAEQERMGAWHHAYRAQVAPLHGAWFRLLEAAAIHPPQPLRTYCERLRDALRDLETRRILPVPDGAVDLYLKRSLVELDRASGACLADRPFETEYRLEVAQDAFDEMGRQLERFGLAP